MRIFLFPVMLLLPAAMAGQTVQLSPVATGLEMPVAITHAGDDRLFITLQRGLIVIRDAAGLREAPFLDIRAAVLCCGERGLFSTAFHPRFGENGFFFVFYTDPLGDLVVARYKVSENPHLADPSSARVLLTIPHRDFGNHNGGPIAFGPDGYLYIGTGDGGGGGDPLNNGQNLQSLLGKLLRIDVDAADPYAIPSSNPFVSNPDARDEIWAYGLRNPWRFSFDRMNGDLFLADVGQGLWEEVNHQPAGSNGGQNYGWRIMEGAHCYHPSDCNPSGFVLPIIEYGHSNGACSVTGGPRYRGGFSRLFGMYIYGDFCNGNIWGALPDGQGRWSSTLLADVPFNISSFGEDVRGEIYVADYAGRILRLEDAPGFVTAVTAEGNHSSVHVVWQAVAGASDYEVSRSANGVSWERAGTSTINSLTDTEVSSQTAYLYRVRARSGGLAGAWSPPDVAVTLTFDEDPLTIGQTIRATHLLQLRAAVSALRTLAGFSNPPFTDPTPSVVRAIHPAELRARLSEARRALHLSPLTWSDPSLLAGVTPVRAQHFQELREGVR